ncbi:MAG: histidine kinase [bacterium]|nr:histidine kinase [bacterium]
MTRRRIATYALIFALYTAIGTLFFVSGYLDDLSRQIYGTAPHRALEEYVGVYTALALLPAILWFARRFRMTRENWPATGALTLLAAIVYSVAHTTLNAVFRDLVSLALGMGRYDYGVMLYRYPMEGAKDVIYFFIFVGFVNFFDGLKRARAAELRAAELQTKLAQAMVQNLQLQLNPHFLFNALNAVSSVMYEDVAKADAMLAQLSEFLRTVLATSSVQQVPLAQEIAIERAYVEIMRARLERPLDLDVRVEARAADALVPFMLVQPLLENSILHGVRSDADALRITLAVRRDGAATLIDVEDDGVGFPAEPQRGVGLQNVEARLRYLYDAQSASFAIGPREGGGTLARIVVPFSTGASA